MYKSILIPVDLGNVDHIDTLIEHAAVYKDSNPRVVLLNVVENIPSWAAVELPRGSQDKSVQAAQKKLQALADSVDIGVEAEVRVGHPYKTILEVAGEMSAELIIVASHQPEFQNYLLGSTAAKIVRHATCSVIVVR